MTYSSTVLADTPEHYWRLLENNGSQAAADLGSAPVFLWMSYAGTVAPTLTATSGFGWTGPVSDGGSCSFSEMWLTQYWRTGDTTLGNINLNIPGALEAWVFETGPECVISLGWVNQGFGLGTRLFGLQILPFKQLGYESGFFQASINAEHGWHHYVVVFTASAVQLYVDGSSAGSTAVALANVNTPRQFGIAIDPNTGFGLFGQALVAEVASYNYALGAGAIANHYAAADNKGNTPFFVGTKVDRTPIVPTGWIVGTAHSGLTGTGEIILSFTSAVQVTATIIPGYLGQSLDTPEFYFDLGFITPINAQGAEVSTRVSRVQSVVALPALTTAVGYALAPGVTATIVELSYSYA